MTKDTMTVKEIDAYLRKIASILTSEDRKQLHEEARNKVGKWLIKLAQMVENGELFDTNAKKMFKDYQTTLTYRSWKILGEKL